MVDRICLIFVSFVSHVVLHISSFLHPVAARANDVACLSDPPVAVLSLVGLAWLHCTTNRFVGSFV